MARTVIFSESPTIPGFKAQIPLTTISTFTPALEAL